MSADNGYILRENDAGQWVLQTYFASDDEFPPIANGTVFDTLSDAIRACNKLEAESPSEYGLSIQLGEDNESKNH